ncbi:MAG: aminotransferase class IV [Candidatus Pelagibacter sp.]
MATLLLKKSYLHKNFKEIKFNDLWNLYGIFTTMNVVGKPYKILHYNNHVNNLVASLKLYKINIKNLKKTINFLINENLDNGKSYDHLFRVAVNKKIISISLRKRPKPKKNFRLKLINYQRVDASHKNLKYKKILKILGKLDTSKFDIALYKNNKILESGTSNLIFVKKNKIYTPKINCYIGNTLKFFKKKYKINFTNILKNNLKEYNEIILVGSGKGVTSVKEIVDSSWKRSSFKIFNKLYKTLENEKIK